MKLLSLLHNLYLFYRLPLLRQDSCTEAPSITSNAVIQGPNAFPIVSDENDAHIHLSSTIPQASHIPCGPPPSPAAPFQQFAAAKASQANINTWTAKLQKSIDRKLKNHSSPSLSPDGIPRV